MKFTPSSDLPISKPVSFVELSFQLRLIAVFVTVVILRLDGGIGMPGSIPYNSHSPICPAILVAPLLAVICHLNQVYGAEGAERINVLFWKRLVKNSFALVSTGTHVMLSLEPSISQF